MKPEYIEKIKQDCLQSGAKIRAKYISVSRIRMIVDLLSLTVGLVGIAVTVIALVPSTAPYFSGDSPTIITLAAIIIILTQVSIERIVLKDPPSRFGDYAHYLSLFPQNIDRELARDDPDEAKIEAWIELALDNLNDAQNIWPELVIRT